MKKIKSGKFKKQPFYPRCKKTLDGWTGVTPETMPRIGDVFVCVYCSTVLVLKKGFKLKRAPAEIIAQITLDLSRAQGVVKEIQNKKSQDRDEKKREHKRQFGFIEGETQCAMCKEILSIEDAHWAFGQWWHTMVKDCHK